MEVNCKACNYLLLLLIEVNSEFLFDAKLDRLVKSSVAAGREVVQEMEWNLICCFAVFNGESK